MKKRPEVTERTRQAFVDAFCEMYAEMPIERIYIKDITEKTGYNRSTFYQYFQDIYAICEYVENDVLDYIRMGRKNGERDAGKLLLLLQEKEKYLRALLGEYGSLRFLERIKKEILPEDSEKEGDFRGEGIAPYLAEFHISVTLSLFRLWLARGKDLETEELSGLIHGLFMNGMGYVKII